MKRWLSFFPFHRLGLHDQHLSLQVKGFENRKPRADRKYSLANFCNSYNLDPQVVQTEFKEFRHAYRAIRDIARLHDLIPDDGK